MVVWSNLFRKQSPTAFQHQINVAFKQNFGRYHPNHGCNRFATGLKDLFFN